MRAIPCLLLAVVACGESGGGEPPFNQNGGTYDVPDCGYSITTKFDAEMPRPSGSTIGKDPAPKFVHLGFVGDPKTTIVAQWRTGDEATTAGEMRYGMGANLTPDQLTTTVKGLEFRYAGTGMTLYRAHQAHACGLQPATTYSYQVGDGKNWSAVATFHTAPDTTANPAVESLIGWAGDSRLHPDVWGQISMQLQQRMPDVLFFSGDAVFSGLNQIEWDAWFEAGAGLLASTPIVFADGNHEDNAINFYSQFAMPGDQENFGIDYGFAHFTIANDTPEEPNALTTTTLAAVTQDFMASASARWKLLMHHQAPYSVGARDGSNLTIRATWVPVIDQYGIDLVLNGHNHTYEVTKPIKGGVVQADNTTGTVYVVAGGAGADLDQLNAAETWSDYGESTHSGAMLHVRRDQMTLDPFRQDGTAIPNGFTKTKP